MEYAIREIKNTEYGLLKDFLYEAIFIPEGCEAPDRSIIDLPKLQVYIEGFGSRASDKCLVAETGGKVIGAVWTRMMDDYGHIDDETPSLAVSLYKEYRGQGIGTALMESMLELLKRSGFKCVSLSVQKANYAAKLYLKLGFRIVRDSEEEYIMAAEL